MNADPLTISKVFSSGGDVQYVLPRFQREYAWEKSHWQTLFDDVMELYRSENESENETIIEHFMGVLVVIQDGDSHGTMSKFTLVDGQQRLTTISILLCALKEFLDIDSRLHVNIEKLLVNPDEQGDLYYKVMPTKKNDDQKAYFDIVDGERTLNYESGIVKAWIFFRKCLSDVEDGIDTERLFHCIVNCMQVVFIKLNSKDKPYKIFESLNAKGKPLTPADLVRNYIAMKLPAKRQDEIFDKYWAKIDELLSEQRKGKNVGEITAFLRHYLAKIYGKLPSKDQVYTHFRDHMERNYAETDRFIDELTRLSKFAGFYSKLLRPGNETNSEIRVAIQRLNVIVDSVCYPLLLHLYDLYESGRIHVEALVQALNSIENYGVRTFIADEKTKSLNQVFAASPSELEDEDLVRSLNLLLVNRGYPTNERVRQLSRLRFRYKPGSTAKRLILVLLSIDRYLARNTGGYPVLDDDETIEHIMPRTLNAGWKEHLGRDWEEDYEEHLNTLGNLTLVTQGWNSELSNGSFQAKKEMLAQNALHLNRDYFSRDMPRWNKETILERTNWLTDLILEVWFPLGGIRIPGNINNSKPRLLIIENNKFPVTDWREVMIQTVEFLIPRFVSFDDEVAERFHREVSRIGVAFSRKHQLSNEFWLNLSKSNAAIYGFCKRYVRSAGLHEHDWDVEYE